MLHRTIVTTAKSALAGLALAGCGVFAPEDPASATEVPTEPAPAVGAEEHTTGLDVLPREVVNTG